MYIPNMLANNSASARASIERTVCGPFALRFGAHRGRNSFPDNSCENFGGGCWVRTNAG